MKKNNNPQEIPQYRTISTTNGRHIVSAVSEGQLCADLDRAGELAAQDAQQPGKWLRVTKDGTGIVAEDMY